MQDRGPGAPNNRIEELLEDHKELTEYLQSGGRVQLGNRAEDAFAKTLIVAAASYFEVRLTQIIIDLYIEMTQGVEELAEFVRRQAIGRRFAQLFQWGDEKRSGPNANSFYRLFGDGFYTHMSQRVREDRELDDSVKAFLEIGNLRNQMVHENYADFRLNKTVMEVYSLYTRALKFVEEFPAAMREFISQQNSIRHS